MLCRWLKISLWRFSFVHENPNWCAIYASKTDAQSLFINYTAKLVFVKFNCHRQTPQSPQLRPRNRTISKETPCIVAP